MDPIVLIIIVAILALLLFAMYYMVDTWSKKKPAPPKPAAPKPEPTPPGSEPAASGSTGTVATSNLANEIEAMIVPDHAGRAEKVEIASARSRMHTRQARMLEYYDKKYKGRTMIFDPNSFDEPIGTSSSSIVVDGIEITQDDIKKLTALQGLLERKGED